MTNQTENSTKVDFTVEELNKLGLNEHPFIEHAGDNYLYSDDQLDMTANIIMDYLGNPTTTIVLTGEEGLGKTTFLRKVLRLGYQQYQFCTLRANHQTSFASVEQKIRQRWSLSATDVATPPEDLSIENYVISYLTEHAHAVLIIDDADSLDLPTLDRLFTLKHRVALAYPNGLGLILAGDSKLVSYITELEETNPACTQVYQINVRPFTKEQTANYIKSRLITAGLEDDMLFNEYQLSEIHDLSKGNISLIHDVSTGLLAAQLSEDNSFTDILDENIIIRKPKSKLPLILIPLVLLIGIGLYFNFNQTNEVIEEVALPNPSQAPDTTISSLLEKETNIDPAQKESVIAEIATAHVEPIPESFPEIKEESDTSSVAELPSQIEKIEETAVEVAEKTKAAETSIEKQDPPIQQATAKSGTEWLKSLTGTSYTLQVIATSDIKKLETLAKQEKLSEQYGIFQKVVNGKTYHVLVVGNFASRDQAAAYVEQLSEQLQKNKPWPIKLDQVQKHL
jgi:septal ring-binding cell division protein DamX/type II secretory pathway predicted ATPase ExeA